MKKILIFILIIFIITFLIFAQNTQSEKAKNVLIKVSPSVVKVVLKNHKTYIASGVAIENNTIVSTYKIAKQSGKYTIILSNGKSYPATLIGKDKLSSLAFLKISKKILKPIKLNYNSSVGDWVAFIGVSYDSFPTIYQGIVSVKKKNSLLLNAPIVPGLSGGAVVNENGELIGIVKGGVGFSLSPSYIFRNINEEMVVKGEEIGGNNVCYAIPSNTVKKIAFLIKKFGKIKRGWLGVYVNEKNGKLIVEEVIKNSPAEKYGIKKGDFILKINGKKLNKYGELVDTVRALMPGEWIRIKIKRKQKTKIIKLKVGTLNYKDLEEEDSTPFKFDRKSSDFNFFSFPKSGKIIFNFTNTRFLGINVYEISSQLAKYYGIKEGYGLLISSVSKGSAAEKSGLKAGDIIVRVKGKPVKTVSDIRKILNSLKDNEKVKVEFYRNGRLKSVIALPQKREDLKVLKNIEKLKENFSEFSKREKLKEEIKKLKKELDKVRKEKFKIIGKDLKEELKRLQKDINNFIKELNNKYAKSKKAEH